MPRIGDVITVYELDTSGNEGKAGIGVTWDFSKDTNKGIVNHLYFMSPAGSPYASYFTNATIYSTDSSTNWSYYLSDSAEHSVLGYVDGYGIAYQFTPKQEFYSFPLSYNNWEVFKITGVENTGAYVSGTDSSIIDGYGTLILPDGTVLTDVVRQVTIENTRDSTNYGSGEYNIDLNRIVNYNYYQQSSRYSIIHIGYSWEYVIGGTSSGTTTFLLNSSKDVVWDVLSSSAPTAVTSATAQSAFTIYPNPGNGVFNVQLPAAGSYTVKVSNVLGAEIATVNTTSALTQVDLSTANAGIYYVTVAGNAGSSTQKIVIQ